MSVNTNQVLYLISVTHRSPSFSWRAQSETGEEAGVRVIDGLLQGWEGWMWARYELGPNPLLVGTGKCQGDPGGAGRKENKYSLEVQAWVHVEGLQTCMIVFNNNWGIQIGSACKHNQFLPQNRDMDQWAVWLDYELGLWNIKLE